MWYNYIYASMLLERAFIYMRNSFICIYYTYSLVRWNLLLFCWLCVKQINSSHSFVIVCTENSCFLSRSRNMCLQEFSRLLTLREKYRSSKSIIRNWKKITANIFDQSWIIVRSIYFRISRRKSLVVVETNANFRRHQWLVNKTLCTYGVYILCLISQYYLV